MARRVYWIGKSPGVCSVCVTPLLDTFVDGKTRLLGRWGCLCLRCHAKHGYGLGLGAGQQFERQEDGKWLKVAG